MAGPRKTRPKGPPLSPEILKAIEAAAEKAAKRATTRAVREVLLALGEDVRTPEGIIEAQKDRAFARRFRLASESRPAKFGFAIFTALLSLIGGVIGIAIKSAFENGKIHP